MVSDRYRNGETHGSVRAMMAPMVNAAHDALDGPAAADLATLRRLESGMRAAMSEGRERHPAGGLDVFLSSTSDNHLLSLGLPAVDGAPPWRPSIEALLAIYAPSGRRPRLEIFDELHPTLAPALEAAGFVLAMRAPLMALAPGDLADLAGVGGRAGAHRSLGHDDPDRLTAFLRGQSVAYGGSGADGEALAWLPSLLAGLERGTIMAAALELEGELVSGATLIFGGGVAELAGVWTEPRRRRQGLAFEVCRRLLADAFDRGLELGWLSAAEEGLGVYRRLGFERVGTQLNYEVG